MKYRLDSKLVADKATEALANRGVDCEQIAEIVLHLQKEYYSELTLEECLYNVHQVLTKREVQNAVLTGIQLDILAEKKQLASPLLEMIVNDESLYGCDEILALSIVNVYGSIGLTNFGHIDKVKPGIIERLNDKTGGQVHTFLDDIVAAIAASACSRIAHGKHVAPDRD